MAFTTKKMTRLRPILFLSSNGVGIGHITRQLAIAKRLPREYPPFFHTQALACSLVFNQGVPANMFPHHDRLGMPQSVWNKALSSDLLKLADRLKPAVIVVDSTAIFEGYLELFDALPSIPSVWIRRAMWSDYNAHFLDHSRCFTSIIEPSELAADLDRGPTSRANDNVETVPPVLLMTPGQRQSREFARQRLEINANERLIALSLGASVGEKTIELRRRFEEALSRQTLNDVTVVEFVSPLAPPDPIQRRWRQMTFFPMFALSTAFDALVTFGGYNSFHEAVLGAIPTAFLTNASKEMDRQDLRASWAVQKKAAFHIDQTASAETIADSLECLLDPDTNARMRSVCQGFPQVFGATKIAERIVQLATET